ncbi:MAG: hypothetical protein LC104_16280 [Bacteroidales bacterium]|nr:hypothetical protein [Bacteroidales bacterium]
MHPENSRFRLRCEGLEARDVPSAVVPVESFDRTAVGALPTDWASWQNDWPGRSAVTAQQSLSGAQGLALEGGSASEQRAWTQGPLTSDASAKVAVRADSLIPATLFVRGEHLDSTTPSYYGLTVTRGMTVQLVARIHGVQTVLGSVQSADYFSQKWVDVQITAVGSRITATVQRADTGQWLSPAGTWVDTETTALEAVDFRLDDPGFAGVARTPSYSGQIVFDDFQPRSLAAPPVVTASASQPLEATSGLLTFTMSAESVNPVTRVEFKFEGRTLHAKSSAPASWTLDTTRFHNGTYELVIRAIDNAGNVGSQTLTVVIANPKRPQLPAHFDHIRIAQLAYNGTPLDQFELNKLQTAVDLVIPNVIYQGTIQQAAPDTPQLIYTNLSNMYFDQIPSWLNTADRLRVSRELAFYHVSQATPWKNASSSATPVNRFWDVFLSGADASRVDQTSAAYGGRGTGPLLPAANASTVIGYPDRFREINFDLSRGAGAGYAVTLEYPVVVAHDGSVTQWKTLTLLADGTAGLTQSGRITFDPPKDWVPATGNAGDNRFFYVRIRAVTGTADQVPIAKTILGRDFDNSGGKLTGGVIPAFDSSADHDGDGYLNDAEYAGRKTGFDARFVYESRLYYPNYGPMRYVVNPSSPAVQQWAAQYQSRLLAANPIVDGLFVDNSNGRLPTGGAALIESTDNYKAEYVSLLATVRDTAFNKLIFTNTVGGLADAVPVAVESTGVIEEFALRPMQATWSGVLDIAKLVSDRLNADIPVPYVVLDTYPGGGGSVSDPRTQLGALAYYYLMADPDRTMIMFFGGDNPAADWDKTWIHAAEVNVGRPTGAMTVWATGSDPENPALDYRVYSRDYGQAVVLFKPRSYKLGQGTGTINDATATQHQLTGNYQLLNADGTRGPVQTNPTITLRNGEGAILLKV